MAFTKLEKDMDIIQKLDNEPNDVSGMTSAEMKAKFDEGNNAMKEWINNVFIPEAEKALENALLGQIDPTIIPPEKIGAAAAVHAAQHAADGTDPITADMIGAMEYINANTAVYDMDAILTGGAHCKAYKTGANTLGTPYKYGVTTKSYALIFSFSVNASNGVQMALVSGLEYPYIRRLYSGTVTAWVPLATTDYALAKADKPSGSYTGNGDATSRTISLGGIGTVLYVQNAYGFALVNNTNGFYFNTNGAHVLPYAEAHYVGGVLTLATTNSILNKSGAASQYQVL